MRAEGGQHIGLHRGVGICCWLPFDYLQEHLLCQGRALLTTSASQASLLLTCQQQIPTPRCRPTCWQVALQQQQQRGLRGAGGERWSSPAQKVLMQVVRG